jgi:hypothetical protein
LLSLIRRLVVSMICIPLGAAGGFLAILLVAGIGPMLVGERPVWAHDWLASAQTAAHVGVPIGAILLPPSYLVFLRKTDLRTAIPALTTATAISASIGYLIGNTGGAALVGLGGYLMTCLAMWRRHALGMKSTMDDWWIDRP